NYILVRLIMENIDKIFQESNDLELIVSYYEKNNQPKKAVPHIKRIFDKRFKEKGLWDELIEEFRKYSAYLTSKEQRHYVNKFVKETTDTFHYEEAKDIILEEFSELVDDKKFSSFFSNTLYYKVCFSFEKFQEVNDVYALIEKHKNRIDKKKLKPKLAEVLAKFAASGKAKQTDITRFESYLDNKAKSYMVIKALDRSAEPAKILAEFRDYLSQKYAYDIVKEMVNKELKSRLLEDHISMESERDIIKLLKKDFLTDKQVKELVNKIANAQFNYSKPGRVQRDPAGDIHEEPEPDYGLPYAFDTVKQFPDDVKPKLAKKIIIKYLGKQFYEEASERRSRKTKGIAKETIKACKIDRDTIEHALADAVKQGLEWVILDYAENVLKKFPEYINREYIAKAIAEKLPDSPSHIIKNFGHYLSDQQLKDAVKDSVRKQALEDNFRNISELIESAESKFSQEELSDFFLGLFEDVKNNIEISEFQSRKRNKKDAALEFLNEFSSYIPRNKSTEAYYELLDIKREADSDE
ncbi:hypothetical protein KY342_01230, partial [Candidatus Woesearchaeota archaeon]|nr:hypothetical protein [Candidatus Woesearchaeota archaeon]